MHVLIADDHALVRDTLCAYLARAGDVTTLTAPDLDSAKAQARAHGAVDLLLLDLNMPGMQGLGGLQAALTWPEVAHVALFTGETCRALALRAITMGARGFLPKTLPAASLLPVLRFMALGETYMPPALMRSEATNTAKPRPHPLGLTLTARDQDVLKAISAGHSNGEIAKALGLSEPTLKRQIKSLYRRLGVTTRTQAALMAAEHNLI